jgi:transcriptional regulator with XRE-family HTH domain
MGSRKPRQYYCRCGTHLAKDNTERQCARCQRSSRDKFIIPPEVPAEFWETEQFREAFAAQHIGWVLRAYRTHPHHYAVYGPDGISQTLLGQWLGLRQPQVSKIEIGPPIPHLDRLQHWARVLRIPAELLWFRLPEDKGKLTVAEPAISDLAHSSSRDALEFSTLLWVSDLDEVRQSAVALWDYALEDGRLASATDTTTLSTLTLRWLVGSKDDAVFRRAGWPRVGLSDVMRLRAVRRQLKALDDAHGGGTAFPMAVTYLRREVAPLLQGHYDDSTGRALFVATAELKLDVGWMAYDAGNYELAWRYMVQALRLSHVVDNRLFGARVLAAMSHQALHLHYVPLAVDLVLAAREGTKRIAPPKAQAMLAAMEACAQAADQRARPCVTALAEAETSLHRVGADDEPDWLDFDQGGLSGHAARALRDLRQPGEAKPHAVASLAQCQGEHCRTRAQRNMILAMIQLQLGDVEAAAATGLLAVVDAWGLHSSRVYSELAALVRLIEESGSTAVTDFVERAHELLATRQQITPGEHLLAGDDNLEPFG